MNNPLVIAEAGVNHNGSFDRAVEMIKQAALAGVDYVKFQTFIASELVTSESVTADYQKLNCNADSQLKMLLELELSFSQFAELSRICKDEGVGFLSTPFDMESVDFLASLGIDFMKIPSGEITNLPYLRRIAATGIPAIISTGMSSLGEIEDAVNLFCDYGYGPDNLSLLHCNTEYPTPLTDVNLRAIETMKTAFGLPVGYSDHTRGIEVPIAATALGATIIEKHFTLSRSLPGPDHAASLEPDELTLMVSQIRNVAIALGNPRKTPTPSELKNRPVARKSIVASRYIKKGEVFSEENLTVKRPGTGLSPMLWDFVIGRRATCDFKPDQKIEL